MFIRSIEEENGPHCLDFIEDESTDTFTFKMSRKDPEDDDCWSLTADYPSTTYHTQAMAFDAAKHVLPWL